ncbi:MAG: putative ribonuclease [Paucimonas sp.]|jgi:membrane protein|nr:putative ribonuclease [Paucimonas sp.]
MKIREIWPLVKKAVASWSDDYAPSMGAALAYYTLFSVAPLLLIVISVAGLVFGVEAAQGAIFSELRGMMGEEGALAVQGLLQSVNKPSESIAATIIGTLLLIVGATTVLAELQSDLDRIWRAPQQQVPSGIWAFIRARLLSLGMIMGIGFLLMVSLVLSAVLSALGKWWGHFFIGWEVLAQVINFLFGFLITVAMFAMIYKFIPRVKIRWHDVWIGAVVTAFLFSIGKFVIGLYIGKSGVTSGYGAAGSLVVVLLWVYYSAQIFLLGAEFTWVYSHMEGSRSHIGLPSDTEGEPRRSNPPPA